ncbi:MAG: rhodanese-like domain-containing protein [Rhizobiaceae bacterium]
MSLLSFFGLGSKAQVITPPEIHSKQCAGELLIIDVRQPNEWHQTGIPAGSHGITHGAPDFVTKVKTLAANNPDCKIALSCLSGMRTKAAVKQLSDAGVTDLYIVQGGLLAWAKYKLPLDAG